MSICHTHLFSINTIVVSKSVIFPGLTLNKHHAIKIDTLASKKKMISFLNCLVKRGTLRSIIMMISIKNRNKRSKIFGNIKAIILRMNTIKIFVIGCNFTKIEFEGI